MLGGEFMLMRLKWVQYMVAHVETAREQAIRLLMKGESLRCRETVGMKVRQSRGRSQLL